MIHNYFENIDTIFWDFDGVLMESNAIRDKGFELVLKDFPEDKVNQLLTFHQKNGGLSRYVKFRYFFEEILGQSITEEQVQEWADKFSEIMLSQLKNKELLISETVDFVKQNCNKYNMYIVSGSDQKELREICFAVEIKQFFKRIHGSPKPKKKWVAEIIAEENIDKKRSVLIGDSINDFEAADHNDIGFYGYNNLKLKEMKLPYIEK